MVHPAIGTRVSVDGLQGVIVGHRPQGMVDIRVEGEDFIARKRASALHLLNPQRGAPSDRVRREVEKMLHNPPSSWKALYRRAGLPARPSADDFIDIVRSKTPSGRSAEAHYGQEMGEGRHVPPKAVREAALHGLRLSYDNNYTSQSGVGLARAVQLALDPSIDDLAKTRMRAYLTRHERDKQGKNFGNDRNPSNGYMAWLNWGGDPAKEWLNMRNNPLFGFGSKKKTRKSAPKTAGVDPKESFQKAIELYHSLGEKYDEVLVLALNKKGDGHAWYWLPSRYGLGIQAFKSAGRSRVPKRYITAKDPTQDVIKNLMSYRNAGSLTYVTIDTFTGKVTGPFKGSEVLPAVVNPAGSKLDVKEKQDEQFRAVVQGIYESLMAKRLGVKSIYTPTGRRRDVAALRMGTLSKAEQRAILSRAFAIATRQGQKHGYLIPGTQQPTAKGRRRAYKRHDDRQSLSQNEQDREITLSMARKGSALRIVAKGRGKSRRFHVQPLMPGLNPKGYKTQGAAKAAITRLRRNPEPPESLKKMWSKFDDWVATTPVARLKYAPREHEALMRTLVEDNRRRGKEEETWPVNTRAKAAEQFLEHARRYEIQAEAGGQVAKRYAERMKVAVEAVVLRLAPEKLRGTQQVTKEQWARESRVQRGIRGGARGVPSPVGQSDVGGREFVSGQRQGKQEADRRKAGKAKGKVKAAIGRVGDGIGELSRMGRAADDTTFTAPLGSEGSNFPVVLETDKAGNTVEARGFITYDVLPTGTMSIRFGEGDLVYELYLSIPDGEGRAYVFEASSATEANRRMAELGRTPLNTKPMYEDDDGNIRFQAPTPEKIQALLNQDAKNRFPALARYIVSHGNQKRGVRETWDRPVVAFANVKTFDEKGKPAEFETYVVYGFGGNSGKVSKALRRASTKKKQWRPWKEALGSYEAPIGVWDARASHRTEGTRGRYYVVGPLAHQGMSSSQTKKYLNYLRRLQTLPAERQKLLLAGFFGDISAQTFKNKRVAEEYRKRLDRKFGMQQKRSSDVVGATFAYYLDPAKVGEDGGYGVAVAAADQLRADPPSPSAGRIAAGRERVLKRTKVAGMRRRELADSYEIVAEEFDAVRQAGMDAFNKARQEGDTAEMERVRALATRLNQVGKRIKRAQTLTDGSQMKDALEAIYGRLQVIGEQLGRGDL